MLTYMLAPQLAKFLHFTTGNVLLTQILALHKLIRLCQYPSASIYVVTRS
jgi:hypothetical protein